MNKRPKLGSDEDGANDRMWVIRAAFGYLLNSALALVNMYALLYPLLCNSLTDGLRGD